MSKFNEIKKTFEDSIATSSWWSRHIGSQFIDYLVLFVSKVVERVEGVAGRALQESFLTLATKRTSILAGSETEGYVGRKAAPSRGKAIITNKDTSRITMPILTQAVAPNQVRYTIMQAVDLQPNESVEVDIQQFEVMTVRHTVAETVPWSSVVFPKSLTQRIHKIIVRVDGEVWKHAYKFRDTDGESKAYMEYYKSTDQYGIRFGNGLSGKIPEMGSVIEFELWLTDGVTTLINDQIIALIDSPLFNASGIKAEVKTITSIIGGAEPEDIESIRNGALYSPIYDEQVVWDSDYITFIKRNISGITWLSVWGEKEQEKLTGKFDLDNINTIFICAHSADKPLEMLYEEIKDLFDSREGYNENYRLVERLRLPFTVTVKGYIESGRDVEWAEKTITEHLNSVFGEDAIQNKQVYKHQIFREIESLKSQLGISYFDLTTDNLSEHVAIDTHQFLDITNSVISMEYEK